MALAEADSLLRVMPRTCQPSLSIRRATEPPRPPVAPQTTISLVILLSLYVERMMERREIGLWLLLGVWGVGRCGRYHEPSGEERPYRHAMFDR